MERTEKSPYFRQLSANRTDKEVVLYSHTLPSMSRESVHSVRVNVRFSGEDSHGHDLGRADQETRSACLLQDGYLRIRALGCQEIVSADQSRFL